MPNDITYWTNELHRAQQELEAARRRSEVDAAASKVQRAKAALKRLEAEAAEQPKRKTSRKQVQAARS
jgi:hypothetical protein